MYLALKVSKMKIHVAEFVKSINSYMAIHYEQPHLDLQCLSSGI